MARMHIRLDLGTGATLGALSRTVGDLAVVMGLSLRIDRAVVRRRAEDKLERWWETEPEVILRRLEESDQSSISKLQAVLEYRNFVERGSWEEVPFGYWLERLYEWQRSVPPSLSHLLPVMGAQVPLSLRSIDPELLARLAAQQAAEDTPEPPRIEFLRYENPIELILIGAATTVIGAGLKSGSFTEILRMIRDWSTDREQARADVERTRAETDRMRAEAREVDARARREEFEGDVRRILVSRLERVPPELLEATLGDDEVEALQQLLALGIDVTVEEASD